MPALAQQLHGYPGYPIREYPCTPVGSGSRRLKTLTPNKSSIVQKNAMDILGVQTELSHFRVGKKQSFVHPRCGESWWFQPDSLVNNSDYFNLEFQPKFIVTDNHY